MRFIKLSSIHFMDHLDAKALMSDLEVELKYSTEMTRSRELNKMLKACKKRLGIKNEEANKLVGTDFVSA